MPDFGPGVVTQIATRDDLDQILGEMQDNTAVAILALHPTVAQLEEARIWLDGVSGDLLGKERRPLDDVVGQIFDMLTVEEDEPLPHRH